MNAYTCTNCKHDASLGYLKECDCKPNWYDTFEKSNVMQEFRLRKQQRKLTEQDIVNTLFNNGHKFAALRKLDAGSSYPKAQELAKEMIKDANHNLWEAVVYLHSNAKQYV